jgi:hypothetical protein
VGLGLKASDPLPPDISKVPLEPAPPDPPPGIPPPLPPVAEANELNDDVLPELDGLPVNGAGPPLPTDIGYDVEALIGPTYIAAPPPPPPPLADGPPTPAEAPPPPTTVILIFVVVAGVINNPGEVNTCILVKPPPAAAVVCVVASGKVIPVLCMVVGMFYSLVFYDYDT